MPFVTPTPTAPFSEKIHLLGRMLAACAVWRTQSGLAADDLDAEELLLGEESETRNLFYPCKEDHDEGLVNTLLDGRPAAVISPITREYATYAGGAQNWMTHNRGVLLLIVMDQDRVPTDLERSARTFENFWGTVIAELAAQSGADWDADDYPGETLARLPIAAIKEDQAPQREPLAEEPKYWLASAVVFYGLWPELEVR